MGGMLIVALGLSFFATPAFAYIGPGAGITVLGALWGVVVAIGIAVAAVVLWPLRVLIRRRRNRPAADLQPALSTADHRRDARHPLAR